MFKLAETFNATLSPMLVMFLCMIIGYAAKKLNLVPGDTATVLSKLENYFFCARAHYQHVYEVLHRIFDNGTI